MGLSRIRKLMLGGKKDDIDYLQKSFTGKRLFDKHIAADLERFPHIVIPVFAGQKHHRNLTGDRVVFNSLQMA